MTRPRSRLATSILLPALAVLAAGCAGAGTVPSGSSPAPEPGSSSLPPLLGATNATAERPGPTPGDVHFMTGMIPHHAQAVRMGALVPDRTDRSDIRILAERMAIAQQDEIADMRRWLAEWGEPVPAADATHMMMDHGGVMHEMLMPGMLTEEEFDRLEEAEGEAFVELFLTLMIRHHEGAIIMIDELFSFPGAALDDEIFKFASDMYADQTTEIHHMRQMLTRSR